MHPFLFLDFLGFFSFSFLPKITAEKEPKIVCRVADALWNRNNPRVMTVKKGTKKENLGRAQRAHTRFPIYFSFRIILFVPYRII